MSVGEIAMMENRTLILNADGRVVEPTSPFLTFPLSWVAYVREVWIFLIRFVLCIIATMAIGAGLERFAKMSDMSWLTLIGAVIAIVWTVYSVALTSSVRLFTDEAGVWMQSGVLPWEKGVTGVQWRDLGQAGYTQGFVSWALRSYDIRVSHRFTTDSELYLKNVHRGNLAVEHINGVMVGLQGRVSPR